MNKDWFMTLLDLESYVKKKKRSCAIMKTVKDGNAWLWSTLPRAASSLPTVQSVIITVISGI
jgi:hypothetical protein